MTTVDIGPNLLQILPYVISAILAIWNVKLHQKCNNLDTTKADVAA